MHGFLIFRVLALPAGDVAFVFPFRPGGARLSIESARRRLRNFVLLALPAAGLLVCVASVLGFSCFVCNAMVAELWLQSYGCSAMVAVQQVLWLSASFSWLPAGRFMAGRYAKLSLKQLHWC